MKKLNILGAFLVLCCAVSVSYSHSVALFEAGGFRGWMAHCGVIAIEATFLLGVINLVVSRIKDVPPGKPAIFGGLLGVLLVGWSNVAAGWSFGLTGILLGLVIPCALIVSEAILSKAIINQAQPKTSNKESPNLQPKPNESPESPNLQPKPTKPPIPKTPKRSAQQEAKQAENLQQLQKWVMEFYNEKNKLPSRSMVVERAGLSDWRARKFLDDVKKQIEHQKPA